MYYIPDLNAPAQMGNQTVFNKSVVPWLVEKYHAIFDLWTEDDLLKGSPCYYATERFCKYIQDQNFSGVQIGPLLQSDTSYTFKNLFREKTVPVYYLLLINGIAGVDDFGITSRLRLVVSQTVVDALLKTFSNKIDLEKYELGNDFS